MKIINIVNPLLIVQNLIPQNEKTNFIIKKNEWSYSLDILFEHSVELNLINLYLILKYYITNHSFIIKNIYIIGQFKNEKIKIFHLINYRKFINFDFWDFDQWFLEQYDKDFLYVESENYYGFRILFFKQSPAWIKENQTEMLFPQYPWNENFKKSFIGNKEKILLSNKNKILENNLKKIKKENIRLHRYIFNLKSIYFRRKKK